jgi:protocatechuate 3,4-dioxygenase beta subunit
VKCFILLIPLLPLLAQDTGALVEGAVTHALTGDPVRKCKVTLRGNSGVGDNSRSAMTDAEGRFRFENLEAGRYRLSAEKSGFVNQEFGARTFGRPGSTLTLDKGMQLKNLSLKITPQGVISGKVIDDEGDPVTSASVQLLRSIYLDGRQQLTQSGFAQTNDLGEYRLFGVNPGKYYLNAAATRPAGEKGGDSFTPTYYPGTIDPAAAGSLEVTPGGQLRGIDLALRRGKTVRVRGKFSGPGSEQSSRNGTIQLYPRNIAGMVSMARNFSSIRGTSGTFEFPNVLPGSYILAADQAEDKDKHYYARVALEVGNSNIDDLQLTLSEGIEIAGRIRVEGSTEGMASAMVFLKPRDIQFGANVNGRAKADGTFTLSPVPPGWHRVVLASQPPNLYIKSIRYGQDDALANGLNATGPNQLEIVLSANGGRIDGQTSPAARVGLIPKNGMQEFMKVTTADNDGRFFFRAVAPGDYLLLAAEEIDAGRFTDPDFVKQFESSGEAVSIKEGSRESKQLKAFSAPDAQ